MSIHKTKNTNGTQTTTIITRHQSDGYDGSDHCDNININIIITRDKEVISDTHAQMPMESFRDTLYQLDAIFG